FSANCPPVADLQMKVSVWDNTCEDVIYELEMCNDGIIPLYIRDFKPLADPQLELVYQDDLHIEQKYSYTLDWATTYQPSLSIGSGNSAGNISIDSRNNDYWIIGEGNHSTSIVDFTTSNALNPF